MNFSLELLSHDSLPSHLDDLKSLLSHKPAIATWLLDEVTRCDPQNDLRVDSVIAKDKSKWIGNINVFSYRGLGLVGNVFLEEEYRGHGIGSAMMQFIEAWAKTENHMAHVLWVDPKKRPAAYSMYLKHGYEAQPNSGIMVRFFNWMDLYQNPTDVFLVPLSWKHYPQLNLLSSLGLCGTMASFLHACYGNATFEMEFLKLMKDPTESAWAFENSEGYAVGAAFLKKDPLWEQQRDAGYENNNYLFDLMIESRHARAVKKMLPSFPFPKGRLTSFAPRSSEKYEALSSILKPALQMPGQFSWNGKLEDVTLFLRE